MSFIISRGYAEVQILKTSESDPSSFWNKGPQNLPKQKIKRFYKNIIILYAKKGEYQPQCLLTNSAKCWKSENGLISWTEWNILIDFCVNIDIIEI